jgi:hypothetical protein
MPIEEATYSWSATRGNNSEIVRNGLGARGINVMERVKTGTGHGTSAGVGTDHLAATGFGHATGWGKRRLAAALHID